VKASLRLILCLVMIIGSATYGLLIYYDPTIAEAVALGYVAFLLTIFFATNHWKRS
jgi:hypothetical protein